MEAAPSLPTGADERFNGYGVMGLAVTALSLIVMPLLARAKLSVAEQLGSRALRADAHETIACAWLSATTLAGLGLNALLGWWWADPVAALVMLPLIVREGVWGIPLVALLDRDGHVLALKQ